MLLRIVSILFPLFAIVGVGFLVARRKKPDLTAANTLNMDVFTPALVFGVLAGKDFHLDQFLPLAAATLALIVSGGLIAWGIARLCKVQAKTLVPPIMFNNCGNLGLPLAVLAFGEKALPPAVVMFMISNLMHFSVGAWLLDHRTRLATLWKVPVVAATLLGLVVSLAGIAVWPPLLIAIKMIGDISIPLMLFALGVRLTDAHFGHWRIGLGGAVLRPVAGMAVAALLTLLIPMPPLQQGMLIVFGALPPAVLNFIFAERYQQEPEKVASIVLLGNVVALVFLPLALALTLES